jgi:gamma-glutamyltranspeptidase
MGADAQPQVLLQLIVRLLALGEAAGDAVAAPRWMAPGGAVRRAVAGDPAGPPERPAWRTGQPVQ